MHELNTNGFFITREILQEMKDSGMDPKMKISFDGLGFHDEMRNSKGCEERTLEAIALCKEYGFDTRVQMNLNIDEVPHIDMDALRKTKFEI